MVGVRGIGCVFVLDIVRQVLGSRLMRDRLLYIHLHGDLLILRCRLLRAQVFRCQLVVAGQLSDLGGEAVAASAGREDAAPGARSREQTGGVHREEARAPRRVRYLGYLQRDLDARVAGGGRDAALLSHGGRRRGRHHRHALTQRAREHRVADRRHHTGDASEREQLRCHQQAAAQCCHLGRHHWVDRERRESVHVLVDGRWGEEPPEPHLVLLRLLRGAMAGRGRQQGADLVLLVTAQTPGQRRHVVVLRVERLATPGAVALLLQVVELHVAGVPTANVRLEEVTLGVALSARPAVVGAFTCNDREHVTLLSLSKCCKMCLPAAIIS